MFHYSRVYVVLLKLLRCLSGFVLWLAKYLAACYANVSILSGFLSREKLWICMEYCGGGSLQDIYHGEPDSYPVRIIPSQTC